MYITYQEYVSSFGPIGVGFNRFGMEASRLMDMYTTGACGFRKLEKAFPENKKDVEAVKFCAAKLTNLLYLIDQAQSVSGHVATEQGVHGKVISSISSGNESISYDVNAGTAIDKAAADRLTKTAMISQTIRECLSGVNDRNGVPLLYMGVYPRRFVC